MLSRLAATVACCALALTPAALAQSIQQQAELKVHELTAQLQAHSATARAEGAEAARSMQANDTASACTHYKTSRSETQIVIDLLPQQREQIMLASSDTATAIAKVNRVDEMLGTWLGLASQLDGHIAQVCTG